MTLKMEPIEGSETLAFRTRTPWNYPKENTLHKEHGESLKSSTYTDLTSYRYFSVTLPILQLHN